MATIVTVRESPQAARLKLSCWGDFCLVDSATGADLKPRSRKARALLAYLALHPGKRISRERLTGLLWGGRGEEQARASLRQAILELKPLANGTWKALTVERDHLALDPARLMTDLGEMGGAVAAGEFPTLLELLPDPDERLFANLDDLDEGFDDWLAIERARQHDQLVALVADASAAALAQGQVRHARALHARLREFDPETEPSKGVPAAAERSPAANLKVPEADAPPRRRWRTSALAIALLILLAGIGMGIWYPKRGGGDAPATIAVLPFKSVSGQSASFADGLSEEITAQLARQPGLYVAGRTSSWQFKGRAADLKEVGRKLGVSYILEGSARSVGDRVRVNVSLTKASDGLLAWSETFDGTLDDVLKIQNRIGTDVAEALGRRLIEAEAEPPASATSGAVYSAYLTARGLIRQRNPRTMIAAKEQLERALALDPGFAPAWSSMAQVKRWEGNRPGEAGLRARDEALAHARRALALAPDLAEAHGVLGMILGFDKPAGQRHIKRAAALDPNNAEFQFWLGHVYDNEGDYPRMLAAYRRAFAIDPLWTRAHDYAILSAWRMGYRDEALGYARRVEREGSRHDAHMARGFLATYAGDLSRAVQEFGAARAATGDLGKQALAALNRAGLFFQLGLLDQARKDWESCRLLWAKEQKRPLGMPEREIAHLALKQGELPTRAQLEAVNARRGDPAGQNLMEATAESLIQAGRAGDLVRLYDSEDGLLGLSARRPVPALIGEALQSAPVVASALIAVGRRAEANRILRHSDRLIATALRRSGGRAPAHFYAEAAQTWALLGKQDLALAGLERARRNGWINADFTAGDLVDDIGDEPAFSSLRGDPRFEAIRAGFNADLARERREVMVPSRA